jgi:hypothetical protein
MIEMPDSLRRIIFTILIPQQICEKSVVRGADDGIAADYLLETIGPIDKALLS